MNATPRTGDTVKHRPTGEAWTVAYYDGRDLVPCGWPLSFARLEDCELVERASDEESYALLERLSKMSADGGWDPRKSYAMRVIEGRGK